MNIVESNLYKIQLRKITFNIKKDKKTAAVKFAKDLKKQINGISNMPYKYRMSYYHESENIRDMVFKGYTIIHKIYENHILIVEIFNQNLPTLMDTK